MSAETKTLETLYYTVDGARAELTLNRPDKKNSMSPQLHLDMRDALQDLGGRRGLKVLVVTGVDDSFCAGMDLEKAFFETWDNPDEFDEGIRITTDWYKTLKTFPAATIAKVNGWCFGGGFEIVGLCDMAIAADEATFGLSEINFGIPAGGGTMWTAAHMLSRKPALYYLLTAEAFDGRRAVELNVVNESVPRAELDAAVERLVDVIVKKPLHAIRSTKEVYERTVFMDFPQSVDWEMAKVYESAYRSKDAWIRSGLRQFKERSYRPGFEAYESEEAAAS